MPPRVAPRVNSDGLLRCTGPEGLAALFADLGYPVELLGADYLHTDGVTSFQESWQLAQVGHDGRLRVYLLKLGQLDAGTIRALAGRIQSRFPQIYLLLVMTADWRRLAFVNVRPIFSAASRITVKTYRVTIDRTAPTRSDLDLLNGLVCSSNDAETVFRQQCDAFSVDRVTGRFYQQYRAIFRRFQVALQPQAEAVRQAVRRRSGRDETVHAFTVRLLGRMMFLHFLQKKGWLAGDPRFLERRYEECVERGDLYYNDVLEPLFFEYLSTRTGQDSPWGCIPYLNGGLFMREYAENLVLYIPNDLFDPDRDPARRGLLGFFAGYNFTVDEDTPLDVQVALDPELLGKVFENLMEEEQRGQTGTFYTPRPIVNFMVREALIHRLAEMTSPPIERRRLLALFDDERWPEAALTTAEARGLETAALALRILDPAVGTGAFLVGALHHLVQIVRACRHRLGADLRPGTPAMADLKRRIMRDCLFGVDILPAAIDVAQLRLWLSLVLDLDPREEPDPLPNLDFQIMAGNSLIDSIEGERLAPEQRTAGGVLQLTLVSGGDHRAHIVALKRQFYDAANLPPEQREMYRHQIRAAEMETIQAFWRARADECRQRVLTLAGVNQQHGVLSRQQVQELVRQERRAHIYQGAAEAVAAGDLTTRPFVFELEFADVFSEDGGFDIVIANPPYVSVQGSSNLSYRPELERRYTETAKGRREGWVDDLYVHFVFRGFELARPNGVVCYITSDTYFTIQSKRRMRALLHGKDLRVVAPCDPFNATVDAAVFLAFNRSRLDPPACEFDQMRYVPDEAFDQLSAEPVWRDGARVTVDGTTYHVREWIEGKLRRSRFDPRLWLGTARAAIWEPSARNATLYERLILPSEPLLRQWWDKIKTSENYRNNREEIEAYLRTLKPGDITLLGLIADGGQGLATANNGRFLAYREDTPQGQAVLARRRTHIRRWEADSRIAATWRQCLAEAGGDEGIAIDKLRERAGDGRQLELGKGELYKAVRAEECIESDELERMPEDKLDRLRYHGIDDPVRHWVPFRKGDREGRRWWADEPLYINWSRETVSWLFTQSGRGGGMPYIRNPHLYFRPGITWSRTGNHTMIKARLQPRVVFDSDSPTYSSLLSQFDAYTLLALINAPVTSTTTLLTLACCGRLGQQEGNRYAWHRPVDLCAPAVRATAGGEPRPA